MRKKPVEIVVEGRRWRDSYGNTYHTTSSFVTWRDGSVTEYRTDDPEYGYGDAYLDTAQEALVLAEVIPASRATLWRQMQSLGIDFDYSARNVKRKKDL